MPDPLSILRLAALLAFIGLVAVGLWLLEAAWWVVPPVMAVALLIAWTIEWLAWRGSVAAVGGRETPAGPPAPSAPVAGPAPAEAIVPPERAAAVPLPPEPEPAPAPEREPKPQPQRELGGPRSEPAPEPLRAPAPPPSEPAPEPEPVAAVPAPVEEPPREPRRGRLLRLRQVPPAARPQAAEASPLAARSKVVAFQPRTVVPREWNLWDLERIAREDSREHPERRDEWSFLFLHLRQFADADGSLPMEFDGLVRESFGGLLDRAPTR